MALLLVERIGKSPMLRLHFFFSFKCHRYLLSSDQYIHFGKQLYVILSAEVSEALYLYDIEGDLFNLKGFLGAHLFYLFY